MNASRPADPFGARAALATAAGPVTIHRLDRLAAALGVSLDAIPFSLRVLLEAALRTCDGYQVTPDDVKRLAHWTPAAAAQPVEIPFKPARVILQDFTGVPCVVDLAAMRDAVARMGGDPKRINPLVPVDLVIDHSVQVDVFGTTAALEQNAEIEFARNRERYEFLRWGQKAFRNFRVVPPATGIVHQVNLEYLAQGVLTAERGGVREAFPDSLVGTDSHTTMINGLGVVGWGVGGIEAEAVMLGQPLYMVMPQVVGFRLTGALRDGRDRHRPGAHHHPDAAQEGRGRQVRRVLRPRPFGDVGRRPRHHRQHGARVRRHHGLLPGRRRDAALPPAHQPFGSGEAGRGLHQGAGICSALTPRRSRRSTTRSRSTSATSSRALRAPSARRTGSPCAT